MKMQAFESSKEVSQKNKSKYLEKLGNIFQKEAEELLKPKVIPEQIPTEEKVEEEYFQEESFT